MCLGYYHELKQELEALDKELEATGIEDATDWERFAEMEVVMGLIVEYELAFARYPRERYELDRKAAIENGENPRLIMSYSECIAWDMAEREKEREREMYEALEEYGY